MPIVKTEQPIRDTNPNAGAAGRKPGRKRTYASNAVKQKAYRNRLKQKKELQNESAPN